MLSPKSWLHKIPLSLDASQRFLLEIVTLAAQGLSFSYSQIEAVARETKDRPCSELTLESRDVLLTHAWSMIHYAHAFRRALRNMEPTGVAQEFIDDYESVTKIRNAIEHLIQKRENIVKSRGHVPPAFGTFIHYIAEPNGKHRCRTIASGFFQDNFKIFVPAVKELDPEIGPFVLSVEEHTVDLTQLRIAVQKVMESIEQKMGPEIERGLSQFAALNDLAIETLRRQTMGTLCVDSLVDSSMMIRAARPCTA